MHGKLQTLLLKKFLIDFPPLLVFMICEGLCNLQHASCDREPGVQLSKRNHSCSASQASQGGLKKREGGRTTTSPAWGDDSHCVNRTNMLQVVNQSARVNLSCQPQLRVRSSSTHGRGIILKAIRISSCQKTRLIVPEHGKGWETYSSIQISCFPTLRQYLPVTTVGYYITLITTLI